VGWRLIGEYSSDSIGNDETISHFVKTHSDGMKSDLRAPPKLEAPAELLAYKILEHAGVGSESHFFAIDLYDVHIATRDAGYKLSFNDFADIEHNTSLPKSVWNEVEAIDKQLSKNSFHALGDMFVKNASAISQNFIDEIALLNVITCLFFLEDVCNNRTLKRFSYRRSKPSIFVS
jgi:hypothetical protein